MTRKKQKKRRKKKNKVVFVSIMAILSVFLVAIIVVSLVSNLNKCGLGKCLDHKPETLKNPTVYLSTGLYGSCDIEMNSADYIVDGIIGGSETRTGDYGLTYTDTYFSVQNYIKDMDGEPFSMTPIIIEQKGGCVENSCMQVEGYFNFIPESRYRLFIDKTDNYEESYVIICDQAGVQEL